MFDYKEIFGQRGELYNRASRRFPHARATERRRLIDRLRIAPHDQVCDAPAGGGYLADGIDQLRLPGVRVTCVDPAPQFAAGIDGRFDRAICPLERIGRPDASFDKVGSLAGLHHLPDKSAFYREAHRLLRPGGIFAVADVMEGTPAARFLNGPCDEHSEQGHVGLFLEPGELVESLAAVGFADVVEEHCRYTWDFPSRAAMAAFCKDLFGLTKADEARVGREIAEHLEVGEAAAGTIRMHWSLVYATGRRR